MRLCDSPARAGVRKNEPKLSAVSCWHVMRYRFNASPPELATRRKSERRQTRQIQPD